MRRAADHVVELEALALEHRQRQAPLRGVPEAVDYSAQCLYWELPKVYQAKGRLVNC